MRYVFPKSSSCSMTTTRKGRVYLGTIPNGKAATLQGDKSDVKLEIAKKCPKKLHLMTVRTDLFNFKDSIRKDECFISPVVEVLAPAETSTSSYILRIPHCLDEKDDKSKVNVRMIHENGNEVFVPERAECTDGVLFFDIDPDFIELHTTHFTQVICTICQTPYQCMGKIKVLWYGKYNTHPRNASYVESVMRFLTRNNRPTLHHDVEIRPYFCSALKRTLDFAMVSRYLAFLPNVQ